MTDILSRAGAFVAIILLGYLLKRIGLFKEEDFGVLSKLLLKVTFPCAIITTFAGREIDPTMLVLAFLAIGCGVIYMLVAAVINLRATREQRAFDILNLPGYNIGNFTMPFVQSFLGPTGIIATGIFDMGNAVICLGGAFGVASTVKSGTRFSILRILRALLKSVPFLTYVVMLLMNVLNITLPAPVKECIGIIGSANPFLAMFIIGVGFKIGGDSAQRGKILRLLALRYGIAIPIALLFWFVLPFPLEVRQALVILAFSPIGSAVPPFTAELKGDVGLSSAVNSTAILISIIINVVLLNVIL